MGSIALIGLALILGALAAGISASGWLFVSALLIAGTVVHAALTGPAKAEQPRTIEGTVRTEEDTWKLSVSTCG